MRKFFYCVLFLYSSIFAQEWKYLGLSSEGITAIAVDWSHENVIYAGSGSNFSSGKAGGIFKSTNSGTTWDTLIRGVTVRQIVIHPTDSKILFATLGINSLTIAGIIKSTDGGLNWFKSDSGVQISWELGPGPLVIDKKYPELIYTGTGGPFGGRFYKSTNAGLSWKSFGDTTHLRDGVSALAIHPDSSNIIYAGTAYSGNLLRSIDYGVTWSLTGFAAGIIYSIQFGSKSSTIYVGSSANNGFPVGIFRTTDSGVNWSNPKSGLPDRASIARIQVLNDNADERVFIAGGGVYESIQFQTWRKIGIEKVSIRTITLSRRKLYAGGEGLYMLDIPTSVLKDNSTVLRDFNLYNNFPNPFNPTTTIQYQIPEDANVVVKVYNLLGSEVATLVNEIKPAGYYEVKFSAKGGSASGGDASSLPSGLYLYKISAGTFSETRKMLLMK